MRALVLSGGGSKGAYQVGVLRRWLAEENRNYDILCGVSVGALNTSYLSQFPQEITSQAYAGLVGLWDTLQEKDIYKKWFFGELSALWKPSVYNSEPLHRLVRSVLDAGRIRASGKKLRIGAVNLSTGKYRVFTEQAEVIKEAVIASSAFPVMFLPAQMGEEWWTDGGVREVTPLQAAIEAGATTIDVVLCSAKAPEIRLPGEPRAWKTAFRVLELMMDEIVENDVKVTRCKNDLALLGRRQFRNVTLTVVRPEKELISNSLSFDKDDQKRMIEQGYEDACRV